MILTDKCLKDFTEWNCNKQFDMMLPTEYPTYLNALIIEFFDLAGIYIEINKSVDSFWIYNIQINNNRVYIWALEPMQETRQEATEKAIIHANKIYNENKA